MATNLPAANNPTPSAIRSSPLSPVVPQWVSLADLDAENFYMPVIQKGQERELRHAARSHAASLQPAVYSEREQILAELRLRTIPRTESQQETLARHRCLMEDLKDVPADILLSGCSAYVNEPGTRFYPTAGELRGFFTPLMNRRRSRGVRLTRMADEAESAISLDEIWKPEPGETGTILAEYGLKSVFKESAPPTPIPTVEEYIEVCGISRGEAEKLVARQTAAARHQSVGKVLNTQSIGERVG